MRDWARVSLRATMSLVLPWECPICGAGDDGERDGPFCPACHDELLDAAGPICARCAMPIGPYAPRAGPCPSCRGHRFGFDEAIALGPYQGPIRGLCLRLKHEPDAWLARWLADLVVESRPELRRLGERRGDGVVVPVPLHWRRRLARGYNQSDELARGVAWRLGLALAQPLRRVRPTEILAGLSRTERARHLQGAFRVPRRQAGQVAGRTVLLVDDILTTGATCGAAARALKQAGAARVVAVVVARAEGRA